METCLTSGDDAYSLVGKTFKHEGFELEVTSEIADMLQVGLDEIEEISGRLFVERRLDLSRWASGQFGTMDVGIYDDESELVTVWDHKFGFIPVTPVENEQLMIYALGFYDYLLKRGIVSSRQKLSFRLVIWQPRSPGGGGSWRIDLSDLLAFGESVTRAAKRTYGIDAERIPGETQCRYCPGARSGICGEYHEFHLNMIKSSFSDFDEDVEIDIPIRLDAPSKMTPARKAYIVKNRASIDKWLDRLQTSLVEDCSRGIENGLLKAVDGREGPRKWVDEAEAEGRLTRMLQDEAYSKKVISPTTAEKLLPPKMYEKLKPLVVRSPPKPILVPLGDERPPIKSLAASFTGDADDECD